MPENQKILVIDDEEDIRSMMRSMLERNGYTVTEAEDGIKALEKVKADPFDHVFVDLRMPNLDGQSFVNQVRDSGFKGKIYIITAHIDYKTEEENVINNKVDGLALKPFVEKELIKLLKPDIK
jgi:CheY-like chemotaxis protein